MKALMLCGIYWNDPLQRHQQFANYLVRMGFDVVFVEHIVSTKFSLGKLASFVKKQHQSKAENPKGKNIKVISPSFVNPDSLIFDLINSKKVDELIELIGYKFDLVINYLPISTTKNIISKLQYSKLIYDCVRNFRAWPGYSSHIDKNEELLIESASLVFTDSYYLLEQMTNKKGKEKVYQFLPVINKQWQDGLITKDVTKIEKISYFGSIDAIHIDMEILDMLSNQYDLHIWGKTANRVPDRCVFHGYESDLKELARQVSTISDAIVLPYRGNMNGVIPAKLFQCLSTYLPVFVWSFYDTDILSDCMYVYKGRDELFKLLRNYSNEKHNNKIYSIMRIIDDAIEENQYASFVKTISQLFDGENG